MRAATLDAVLHDADAPAAFLADGYACIDHFVDAPLLADIRVAYDEVISGRVQARLDRMLGGIIRQVRSPSTDHPFFVDNPAVHAGRRLAAHLFGGTADDYAKFYEMLIDKPAGTAHETPWHQDIGYFGRPVAPPGFPTGMPDLQIWVALDDVDADNGCMQFLPRRHGEPAWEHVVASGDPDDEGRLLRCSDAALATAPLHTAVVGSVPAGGATVHVPGTPHYTGPNLTDRPRRAYIFNIAPRGFVEAAEALY
jgi:ectoine hydroxylase-related dioxygenase (phytanoyl-CoA dioxygenase family)